MARYALTALFLFIALPAFADIYKWVDERGTINFTEDLGKVPPKYRKKATVIPQNAPAAAEVTETVVEKGAKVPTPETAEPKDAAGKPQPAKQEKKAVYGGKDENAWKAEFARVRGDIRMFEEELAGRKAKLTKTDKMSRAEYLGIQSEVKRIEEKLADLKGKLSALTESAQKAGVPPELRQ